MKHLNDLKHLPPAEFDAEVGKAVREMVEKQRASFPVQKNVQPEKEKKAAPKKKE